MRLTYVAILTPNGNDGTYNWSESDKKEHNDKWNKDVRSFLMDKSDYDDIRSYVENHHTYGDGFKFFNAIDYKGPFIHRLPADTVVAVCDGLPHSIFWVEEFDLFGICDDWVEYDAKALINEHGGLLNREEGQSDNDYAEALIDTICTLTSVIPLNNGCWRVRKF